jgi:membrane protease YdiL (CAAX protease family)
VTFAALAGRPDSLLALRIGLPLLAAIAATYTFDVLCERRRLLPPGLRVPWRRITADTLLAAVLWIGVFRPIGELGLELTIDPSRITTPQLFALHALMIFAILVWFALGFAGVRPPAPPPTALPEPAPAAPARRSLLSELALQLGFRAPHIGREIGIGLLLGVGAWALVLAALIGVAIVVWLLHAESALPKEPPAIVPWIAALPVGVRLAVSLSAGVVEETFFRGFLQPRIGIALSTAMFALAHLSYGQPLMLVGITLLSLIYAFLVRWRQTVWPAIAAHALFDGVQLLVIIPIVLRVLGRAHAAGAVALLLAR